MPVVKVPYPTFLQGYVTTEKCRRAFFLTHIAPYYKMCDPSVLHLPVVVSIQRTDILVSLLHDPQLSKSLQHILIHSAQPLVLELLLATRSLDRVL